MTSNTTSAKYRQNALWARLMAFVLLAFVAYSTTVEAVHRHATLSLTSPDSSATAVYSSDDANSSANDSRPTGECVICQLRQHLSISLLNALPEIVAPQAQTSRTLSATLPSASNFSTPKRGRAPPFASLV